MTITNHFIQAIEKYDLQLYPQFNNTFWTQYKILLVLYSLGLFFGIVGLIVKLFRRDLWWLRFTRSSQGIRVQQNTTVAFLLFKSIFCLFAIISILEQFKTYRYHGSQNNIQIWRTAIWIPLLFGGIVEAFGIISASSVTRSAQKLITIQPNSKSNLHTRKPIIPYYIINLLSILYPIISLFSIFIPLFVANHWYNKVTSLYFDQIRPLLVRASTSTQPQIFLADILPLQATVTEFSNNSAYWIKVSFGIFVTLAFITFIIFVFGATVLYKILINQRKILLRSASTLRLLASQQEEEDTYKDPSFRRLSTSAATVASARAREAKIMEDKSGELEGARRLLVAQSIVFLICIVGYGINCIFICINPLAEATDPHYYSAIALSAYWLYAVVGLPAMFLVTLSTLRTKSGNFIGSPSPTSKPHTRTSILDLSINQRSSGSIGTREEGDEDFEDLEVSAYELRQLGLKVPHHSNPSQVRSSSHIGIESNISSRTSSDEFNVGRFGRDSKSSSLTTGNSVVKLIPQDKSSFEREKDDNSTSRDEFVSIPIGLGRSGSSGWKPSSWAKMKDDKNVTRSSN